MPKILKVFICFAFCFSIAANVSAQSVKVLPSPDKLDGKSLMQALASRKSDRNISDKALSNQELSNLLWATWGVNRFDGKRTAPTARDSRKVEVYVVLADGVWLYNAVNNQLEQVLKTDERQKYSSAGATLLFAADASDDFAKMHVGSLYQNAGLYCASAGLANVVKGTGKDALKNVLTLPIGYEVMIIQSVGYAK